MDNVLIYQRANYLDFLLLNRSRTLVTLMGVLDLKLYFHVPLDLLTELESLFSVFVLGALALIPRRDSSFLINLNPYPTLVDRSEERLL